MMHKDQPSLVVRSFGWATQALSDSFFFIVVRAQSVCIACLARVSQNLCELGELKSTEQRPKGSVHKSLCERNIEELFHCASQSAQNKKCTKHS